MLRIFPVVNKCLLACNLNVDICSLQSKNKLSLRNLSMVLRQLNVGAEERVKNVEESVDKAKEAVQLDISDGMSWCRYSNSLHID